MTEIEWVDAAFVINPDNADAFDALSLTLGAAGSVREVKDRASRSDGMWDIDPYDLGSCGECILSGWVHAGWEDDIAELVGMCEPTSFAVIHDDSYGCWTKIEKTEEGVSVDQLELRNPFDLREVDTLLQWHGKVIGGSMRRAEQGVAELDHALAGSIAQLGQAKAQIAGIYTVVSQLQKGIAKAMSQEIKKVARCPSADGMPASGLTATLVNAQGASRHAEAGGDASSGRDGWKER